MFLGVESYSSFVTTISGVMPRLVNHSERAASTSLSLLLVSQPDELFKVGVRDVVFTQVGVD